MRLRRAIDHENAVETSHATSLQRLLFGGMTFPPHSIQQKNKRFTVPITSHAGNATLIPAYGKPWARL